MYGPPPPPRPPGSIKSRFSQGQSEALVRSFRIKQWKVKIKLIHLAVNSKQALFARVHLILRCVR